MTLLPATGFPLTTALNNPTFNNPTFTGAVAFATQALTDESTKPATTEFVRQQPLQFDGRTIGIAGSLQFGVGPALAGSTPVGVSAADFYPMHLPTRSFM
jgi:hypothetical protein